MPLTDIGSYVNVMDQIAAHWDGVNTELGGAPATDLKLQGASREPPSSPNATEWRRRLRGWKIWKMVGKLRRPIGILRKRHCGRSSVSFEPCCGR